MDGDRRHRARGGGDQEASRHDQGELHRARRHEAERDAQQQPAPVSGDEALAD